MTNAYKFRIVEHPIGCFVIQKQRIFGGWLNLDASGRPDTTMPVMHYHSHERAMKALGRFCPDLATPATTFVFPVIETESCQGTLDGSIQIVRRQKGVFDVKKAGPVPETEIRTVICRIIDYLDWFHSFGPGTGRHNVYTGGNLRSMLNELTTYRARLKLPAASAPGKARKR